MPPKIHKEQTSQDFFRSINLVYDADNPEPIAHFRPTAKSTILIRALFGTESERSYLIVAPYGSGKSLTATYLLHQVENRPDSAGMLLSIGKRLAEVSPELGDLALKRRRNKRQGFVITLDGFRKNVGESICEAIAEAASRLKLRRQLNPILEMPCEHVHQTIAMLSELRKRLLKEGFDRIVFLWDEFGRHLESLIAEGRQSELGDVQSLAEFASRSAKLPFTLGLLLHQGLLHYATNMPQSVRLEWAKVEGRFETIQYVDDSKELYHLIADVVEDKNGKDKPPTRAFKEATHRCHQLKIFKDFGHAELKNLLMRAYPLEPLSLYLLPRVSARVAQNERTLFTFLNNVDLCTPITLEVLYDYFSQSMRADTGVGGTYRQWLETQSALTKIGEEPTASKMLKSACLLGLGTTGERARSGRASVEFAADGYDQPKKATKAFLDDLIDQKLLLHRRHSDDVLVWHGTDVDLRTRLIDEKEQHRNQFDIFKFLSKQAPPPTGRPAEYNDNFHIKRYLSGEYQTVERLSTYLSPEYSLTHLESDCDGQIIYLLAEDTEELERVSGFAKSLQESRVVTAISRKPLPLFEAALEVHSLMRMQTDADLVGSDPLVLSELVQMTDDAREHLHRLLEKLVLPSAEGPRWFHKKKELKIESGADLRRSLSRMMEQVYGLSPKINNEMIVRKKPTPIQINSRKKLLIGILERHGTENLGIEGHTPDAAMLRTVLVRTGLYRPGSKDHKLWGYAAPAALADPGLRAVWDHIRNFLTEPGDGPKSFRELIRTLQSQPHGVRAGVIPILITAGLRAFPSAISLTRAGEYVTDILPSEIEQLCREPDHYEIAVLDLDKAKASYLTEFYCCFSAVSKASLPETELVRACYDVWASWKAELPPAALTTRRIKKHARQFQELLRKQLDPVTLLFEAIPRALACTVDDRKQLVAHIKQCKLELEDVIEVYHNEAAHAVGHAVSFGHGGRTAVRGVCREWSECFSGRFIENLTDGVSKGLLSRMRSPYDSDDLLLESLSSLLVGRSISRWDDSTIATFNRELQSTVSRIEETALSSETDISDQGTASKGLVNLISVRMEQLFDRLADIAGEPQASKTLDALIAKRTQGTTTSGQH